MLYEQSIVTPSCLGGNFVVCHATIRISLAMYKHGTWLLYSFIDVVKKRTKYFNLNLTFAKSYDILRDHPEPRCFGNCINAEKGSRSYSE
jgi:hypothetical protein